MLLMPWVAVLSKSLHNRCFARRRSANRRSRGRAWTSREFCVQIGVVTEQLEDRSLLSTLTAGGTLTDPVYTIPAGTTNLTLANSTSFSGLLTLSTTSGTFDPTTFFNPLNSLTIDCATADSSTAVINIGSSISNLTAGLTINAKLASDTVTVDGALTLNETSSSGLAITSHTISLNDSSTLNGNLDLTAGAALALNAESVGGNLLVTAAGAISQAAATSLSVAGTTTCSTTGADEAITLASSLNVLTGAVTCTTHTSGGNSGNITIDNNLALNLGASVVAGSLSATANGAITQSSALTVAAGLDLTTSGNDQSISLSDALNAVTGVVSLATHTAGSNTGNVAFDDGTNLNLGACQIAGDFTATVNGAISQFAPLTVAGTANLSTMGNDQSISLGNALNALTGALSCITHTAGSNAGNVTIAANTALNLGTCTVAGNLNAAVNGTLSQSGPLTVAGALVVTTLGNDQAIDLANPLNVILGTVSCTTHSAGGNAGNVTLVVDAALNLGTVNVAGSLSATANGTITQSGALAVTGSVSLATSGNDQSISLTDPLNDLTGVVNVTTHTSGSNAGNVQLNNSTALNLGAVNITGNLAVIAGGAITLTGPVTVTGSVYTVTLAYISAPSTATVGQTFSYTVEVINSGAALPATVVTDLLQTSAANTMAAVQFVSANFGAGATVATSGNTVTIDLGTIPANTTVTGTITVTATAAGDLLNKVTLNSPSVPAAQITADTAVSAPALNAAGGVTLTPVVGVPFTNQTVATFTDPAGPGPVGTYTASINWGDHTPASAGTITYNAATQVFTVSGGHTYAAAGTYAVTTSISHDPSPAVMALSTAIVSAPPVVVSGGRTVNAIQNQPVTGAVVATFTDPGGPDAVGNYTAMIAWGDGISSAGVIAYDAATSTFAVAGSHTYTLGGTFSITVTVNHQSSPAASSTSSAVVADLFRMTRTYDPASEQHFFTTSQFEFQYVEELKWNDETTGVTGFGVPNNNALGETAILRVYNPYGGQHYLTTNAGEQAYLVSQGWKTEHNEGYIFATQYPGTTEVFMLYNVNSSDHLYTSNAAEAQALVQMFPGIWVQQSSLGFAFVDSASDNGTASDASVMAAEVAASGAGAAPPNTSGGMATAAAPAAAAMENSVPTPGRTGGAAATSNSPPVAMSASGTAPAAAQPVADVSSLDALYSNVQADILIGLMT